MKEYAPTRRSVLVVNADPKTLDYIEQGLEAEYSVRRALNRIQAVVAIRENPPDLIVLDLLHLSGAGTRRVSEGCTPTRISPHMAPAEDSPGSADRPPSRKTGLFPLTVDRRLPHPATHNTTVFM